MTLDFGMTFKLELNEKISEMYDWLEDGYEDRFSEFNEGYETALSEL